MSTFGFSNPHRASYEAANSPYTSVDDYFARQEAIRGSWVTGQASALMANYGSVYTLADGRFVDISIDYRRKGRHTDLDANASARVDAVTSISVFKVNADGKTGERTFAYDDFEGRGDTLAVTTRNYSLIRGEWRATGIPNAVSGLEGAQLEAFFQDITPVAAENSATLAPAAI